MKTKVLFVEDEAALRDMLLFSVADLYEAEAVVSAEEALARISQTSFNIAVIDVGLPRMSGLDLIPHVLNMCPGITIISASATNQIDLAVEAMKRGASDFLLKPFDLDRFLNLLTLCANRSMQPQKASLPKEAPIFQMVGHSPIMQD
jgi:DNA-binding NtrC family response regulator